MEPLLPSTVHLPVVVSTPTNYPFTASTSMHYEGESGADTASTQ